MAKVLFLVANYYPTAKSVSRQVATSFINEYIKYNTKDEITVLNLCNIDIPQMDYSILSAIDSLNEGTSFDELSVYQKEKLNYMQKLSDQFIEADKYVIVSPNWNLSLPPQVTDYFLAVLKNKVTFDFSGEDILPLMNDKKRKVLMICSSGYVCSDKESVNYCLGVDWVKNLFNICGVDDFDVVYAEGTQQFPDKFDEILSNAKVEAKVYAKTF